MVTAQNASAAARPAAARRQYSWIERADAAGEATRSATRDLVSATWQDWAWPVENPELRFRLAGALRDRRKPDQRLGVAWRTADGDSRIETEWRAHKETLGRFVDMSAAIAEKYHQRQ